MKLFQYAVFYVPPESKAKEAPKPTIVVDLKTVLAKDLAQAQTLAARSIPDDFIDRLEHLEIAVRPF